jgi:hypothetical protein
MRGAREDDVERRRRHDQAEGDVVPRREGDARSRAEARRDVALVDLGHDLVGDEQHDHVSPRGRFRHVEDGEAVAGRARARRVADVPDDDREAGIAQVERLGTSLVAVATTATVSPASAARSASSSWKTLVIGGSSLGRVI